MKVKIKKLTPSAEIPEYAKTGDAGIERVKKHVSQLSLFKPEELTTINQSLFD